MVIDCHAHWLPPQLVARLRRRTVPPRIEPINGIDRLVTFQGSLPLRGLADAGEDRALAMTRWGVDRQVLSLAGLFGVDCLPAREAVPLAREFNDGVATHCGSRPERFCAIACLPLDDIDASCRELERSHRSGLLGAILPADGFASLASAARYRPLFEVGNALRSHFHIHPGPVASMGRVDVRAQADQAWQRRIVLETQATLSSVMVTLNLTDYLDPYDGVTVQVANLGGALPFLLERMDAVARIEGGVNGPLPPSASMRRCFVDTASFGPRAIALAASCFGADRLLLGTDSPVFDAPSMLRSVSQAGLPPRAQQRILGGNASALFAARARDGSRTCFGEGV